MSVPDFRIDVHVAAFDAATDNVLVRQTRGPIRFGSLRRRCAPDSRPSKVAAAKASSRFPGPAHALFTYSWASMVPPVVNPGSEWVLIASGPTGHDPRQLTTGAPAMTITLQRLRESIPAAHDVGERRDLLARFAALCGTVDGLSHPRKLPNA
jgi:hypothetical protein